MKIMRYLCLPLALAFLAPRAVLADSGKQVDVGQVVNLTSLATAGDVVLCDAGFTCNAMTPSKDIAGVGVFYLSSDGPYTPNIGPANEVTLLGGSQLNYFLTDYPGGFSPNADFLDVNASGKATVDGFTFNTKSTVSTPEPSGLLMLSAGLLAMALASRRLSAKA
jgi:hypothetical protein